MTNDTTDGTTLDGWTAAEFIECANNEGEPINWRGWVADRPVLKAADAARLMAGLNPQLHKNLQGARRNDSWDAMERVRTFEEKAESQGKERASPAEWLAWADGLLEKTPVHVGFRMAVMEFAKAAPAGGEAAPIAGPGTAAPEWEASAREIAQTHWDNHKAMNLQGTLHSYAEHVAAELRRLGIAGPRGEWLSAGTIKREALQGAKWWQMRTLK